MAPKIPIFSTVLNFYALTGLRQLLFARAFVYFLGYVYVPVSSSVGSSLFKLVHARMCVIFVVYLGLAHFELQRLLFFQNWKIHVSFPGREGHSFPVRRPE